jgi:Xaa-Pro dipeptidase
MAALSAGAVTFSSQLYGRSVQKTHSEFDLPSAIENLQPMTDGIVPITEAERKQRIAKAQQLMDQHKIDAIFLEGTVSCYYFTGMRWGQSERTFGIVIPAKGSITYISPKFEEDRAMELINPSFGTEVRCWEEHESPYAVILGVIKDKGVKHHRIGMEERVRFFIADGVKKLATGFEIVDATPITAGCRMYKTKAEIALMQRASDATIEAYKAAFTYY